MTSMQGHSARSADAYKQAQRAVKAVREEITKTSYDRDHVDLLIQTAEQARKWYETVCAMERLEAERLDRRRGQWQVYGGRTTSSMGDEYP